MTAVADAGPRPFTIDGPLPSGLTVLEASAGTGKTWTLGNLAARYLAEGVVELDTLLVVTFGRAATAELRERIRQRLVQTERALRDPGRARAGDDELFEVLASGGPAEVERRRRRLGTALSDFDAAAIATTHQFCQQVLRMLGTAGDTEPDARLVDDLDDLVVEVVDDLYVRAFGRPGRAEDVPFFYREALAIARHAVDDTESRVEPVDAVAGTPEDRRRRFALAVRREVDKRKRQRGLFGYDDLLTRLAGTLAEAGPDGVSTAARRMQDRWRVVLVDEFQDTDPVQWDVLRSAFVDPVGEMTRPPATVILVGDPKQAVYGFRGGDVTTYVAATRDADDRRTLATNYRSDAGLTGAVHDLFDGVDLGDRDIRVRGVTAHHPEPRLAGAPASSPIRLRIAPRALGGPPTSELPAIDKVRSFVLADLVGDLSGLLASAATWNGRPLRARDIAVLVGTNKVGAAVRDALAGAGVPVVLLGTGSVFTGNAAADWLTLLKAMEQPHRGDLARAAALTPFLGCTAEELDAGGAGLTDELTATLAEWSRLWQNRGIAAVLEVASARPQLWPGLLGQEHGERRLTDLRHIGEALQAAATTERLGPQATTAWLRRRQAEALADHADERSRRLDSDREAVQVMTVHASKGLQFPVVYLPFAFDRWVPTPDLIRLHDAAGRRVLDVSGTFVKGEAERARRAERVRQAEAEDDAESLRLLYVAITRAQSQAVLWWAPSKGNTSRSALHRLLFGRTDQGLEVAPAVATDTGVRDRLAGLAAHGTVAIEPAAPVPAARVRLAADPAADQRAVARFDRSVDRAWRRSSYSSLTALAHQAPPAPGGTGSEPEIEDLGDEELSGPKGDPEVLPGRDDGSDGWPASPMAGLPSGTAFGTLVHGVLETVDTGAADLGAEVRRCVEEQLRRRPLELEGPDNQSGADRLVDALVAVLQSPIDAAGGRLVDVRPADRLAELTFELPLSGGDDPVGRLVLHDLADLWAAAVPAHDPFAGYPNRLRLPELAGGSLRGYLNGSIDAVLRRFGPFGPRYVVVDYKTNWLGRPGQPLSSWDYRPDAVAAAMAGSDYPLQALLYGVALHRFLRWRQRGYRPEDHLGGFQYLFVRGMCGPGTPIVKGRPCGVVDWQPPVALIEGASALLDGRR